MEQMQQESGQPRRRTAGGAPQDDPEAAARASGRWVPPPVVPPSGRSRARKQSGRAGGIALLAVAVLVAGIVALLVTEGWIGGRVVPGVRVWNMDVGGLRRDEATALLESGFQYPADRRPVLRFGDQRWPVDPALFQTRLDVSATVEAAMAVGHRGSLGQRLGEQLRALVNGTLVMPVIVADAQGGAAFLSAVAGQVNRPMHNASLSLNEDLSVAITPGQAGREVDEEGTRQALARRIAELGGGDIALIVRDSAPLLTDLSQAQQQVQRILSGPVTLTTAGFEPWTIDPGTLAGWLILRPATGDDGAPTLSVSLDAGQSARLAEQIAGQVARAPVNAQFTWSDAANGLVAVVDSVDGQALDVAKTVELIEQAATSDQRSQPLPLEILPPQLATSDAPRLGIVEKIGEGTTSFGGSSAARVQNITVGAQQFDRLFIAPGETFSFNHYLGEVTAERGYAEGIIIWGNTTRADVGGGLCQVSSTAFRAAFWAGLPIVERHAHAFRVSYYEPPIGLDATIYSPSVDLKWTNDTGHYILIHTYVDAANQTLTFRYYGTNPGRSVEIDGPQESNPVPHGPTVNRDDPTLPKGERKQIEWAKDGLDVTVYRIVKVAGQEPTREMFFSRYLPWQAVYLVGTKP